VEDNLHDVTMLELAAKNKVLKLLLRQIYQNYKLSKKNFDVKMDEFVATKSDKIDNFRARLMLNMDSRKLKKILDYERGNCDLLSDHLPLFT
jgi:hypothetical protein